MLGRWKSEGEKEMMTGHTSPIAHRDAGKLGRSVLYQSPILLASQPPIVHSD